MPSLLAVDLGLRTGLALFGADGRLRWYRSQHFGTHAALRRGAHGLIGAEPDLTRLVLEGGGPIAHIWQQAARRRGVEACLLQADSWREQFFRAAQRDGRDQAKKTADRWARRIIAWSDAPRPTSLRHDAAEAIVIGLWGVIQAGWLAELPEGLD